MQCNPQQYKTRHGKPIQDKTTHTHDHTIQDQTRQAKPRQHTTRQDKTSHDETRQDKTSQANP